MDQQDKIIVQKVRSYRGILSAGMRLYISAFRRFFKASWLMALIYALVNAALGTLTAIKIPELTVVILSQLQRYNGIFAESLQPYLMALAECIVLMMAIIIVTALAHSTIYTLLKEHSETVKGALLTLLVCIPLFIVAPFALPMWYVLTKYIMEPSTGYWTTLRKGYGNGMGHWGSLFLVFFLTMLFILLAGMIVMLPAHILFLANYRAQMGVLIGDPLGMPSYMLPMTFITFVLCSFLYFYLCLPLLLNGYYAYGAIEAKELEHEQQKLSIQ